MKEYSYFIDNDLPIKGYYDQFNSCIPELGKTYLVNSGIFWQHYKIVFVGEGVALGVEVANGNNNFHVGAKCIFNMNGFKYLDKRVNYRLREEV